jgi:hypothetical protein
MSIIPFHSSYAMAHACAPLPMVLVAICIPAHTDSVHKITFARANVAVAFGIN